MARYPKSGAKSRHPAPPVSKTTMVTTRDWRDGYGPPICGASADRKWNNDYGKRKSKDSDGDYDGSMPTAY